MLNRILSRLGLAEDSSEVQPPKPPAPKATSSSARAPTGGNQPQSRPAPLQPGPNDMAEVRPGLFVGSSFAANDVENLAECGIGHILTLTEEPMETTTSHVGIYDGLNVQEEFDDAVEAARNILDEGGVRIHCAAGVSRAPTVTATALAAEEDLTFEEALASVRRQRPQVNPNQLMRRHGRAYLGEGSRPDK